MITRLFVSSGYFSVITTVATIKTIEKDSEQKEEFYDILVIDINNQNPEIVKSYAKSLHNFQEIISIDSKKTSLKECLKQLKNYNTYFNQVFLPHAWFLEYFKIEYDQLFFIYEGLETIHSSQTKNIPKNCICYDEIYLLIPQIHLNLPKIKFIDFDIFTNILKQVSLSFSNDLEANKKYILILLNQDLATNSEILKNYIEIIHDLLITNSNAFIILKPHPRLKSLDFFDILQITSEHQKRIIITNPYMLVENILLSREIECIIGTNSSSLFHAQYLFNIPSFYIEINSQEKYSEYMTKPFDYIFLNSFQDFQDSKLSAAEYVFKLKKMNPPNIYQLLNDKMQLILPYIHYLYTKNNNTNILLQETLHNEKNLIKEHQIILTKKQLILTRKQLILARKIKALKKYKIITYILTVLTLILLFTSIC